MIIDTLENLASYRGIHPNLDQAIVYALTQDLYDLPIGKHAIDGDTIFVIVEQYTTKDPAEAKLEAHQRYADIQIILDGTERMGLTPLIGTEPTGPYNPDRDICFFEGDFDWWTFTSGTFALYLPQDAHAPGISPEEGPSQVHKVVLKIRIDD